MAAMCAAALSALTGGEASRMRKNQIATRAATLMATIQARWRARWPCAFNIHLGVSNFMPASQNPAQGFTDNKLHRMLSSFVACRTSIECQFWHSVPYMA